LNDSFSEFVFHIDFYLKLVVWFISEFLKFHMTGIACLLIIQRGLKNV